MSLQVTPKSLFVVMLCGLWSFHLVSNSYLPRRLSVTSDYLGGQTFSVERLKRYALEMGGKYEM